MSSPLHCFKNRLLFPGAHVYLMEGHMDICLKRRRCYCSVKSIVLYNYKIKYIIIHMKYFFKNFVTFNSVDISMALAFVWPYDQMDS